MAHYKFYIVLYCIELYCIRELLFNACKTLSYSEFLFHVAMVPVYGQTDTACLRTGLVQLE